MTLRLRIEHRTTRPDDRLEIVQADEAGDSSLPSLTTLRKKETLARSPDQADQAEVTVFRDSWADIQEHFTDTRAERFYIEDNGTDIFGGRLYDTEVKRSTVSVILHDPKRDALDAKPSAANKIYDPQADDQILNTIVDRVDNPSGGLFTDTVESQTNSIAFSESHAAPGKSITKLAQATGAEVKYNPDWTIDYVTQLGSDKTATTLEPGGGILGDPRVERKRREDATHVKVLGRGSGTAQVTATASRSSYDEWTDRPVYKRFEDKEIQQESRAEEIAQTIVSELDGGPEYIEVEATVDPAYDPQLGDEYHVQVPQKGVDHDLRAVVLERIIDGDGERYNLVLSNRKLTREKRGERQSRSVDEFYSGDAGQYFFNSERVGFDPVADGTPIKADIRYPENVVGDMGAELAVKSRPYRGRVISAGHTHSFSIGDHTHTISIDDHTHTVDIDSHSHSLTLSDHSHDVTIDDHDHFFTASIPSHSHEVTDSTISVYDETAKTSEPLDVSGSVSDHKHRFTVTDNVTGLSLIISDTTDSGGGTTTSTAAGGGTSTTTASGGGTFTSTSSGGGTTQTTSSGGAQSSTTDEQSDLAPGINEFSNETVSGVEVTLNGNRVIAGIDDPIDRTFDITGQLSAGDNTVEVTSNTLGEIELIWRFEGIRNAQR